jgi:hypothetical protein
MSASVAPHERMTVGVPVGGGCGDRVLDVSPALEAASFEGERSTFHQGSIRLR